MSSSQTLVPVRRSGSVGRADGSAERLVQLGAALQHSAALKAAAGERQLALAFLVKELAAKKHAVIDCRTRSSPWLAASVADTQPAGVAAAASELERLGVEMADIERQVREARAALADSSRRFAASAKLLRELQEPEPEPVPEPTPLSPPAVPAAEPEPEPAVAAAAASAFDDAGLDVVALPVAVALPAIIPATSAAALAETREFSCQTEHEGGSSGGGGGSVEPMTMRWTSSETCSKHRKPESNIRWMHRVAGVAADPWRCRTWRRQRH